MFTGLFLCAVLRLTLCVLCAVLFSFLFVAEN